MLRAAAVLLACIAPCVIATAQTAPKKRPDAVPSFSDFPVQTYIGFLAPLKLDSSDERSLRKLLSGVVEAPNFSGQFRLVQFRTGDGPLGAVIIDANTGTVYRLPGEIVQNDFFIPRTDCLAALLGSQWAKASEEEDASAPLSFRLSSELLVIRQCRMDGTTVTGIERTYYRWHEQKWRLLKRLVGVPPPVP